MSFIGGFQPSKIKTEQRWKHQKKESETRPETERPKLVLRNTDAVLTQESVGGHSSYKMPPGTSRSKKTKQNNNKETTMEAN